MIIRQEHAGEADTLRNSYLRMGDSVWKKRPPGAPTVFDAPPNGAIMPP